MVFRVGNDENVNCQRLGNVSRLRIAYIEAANPHENVEVGDDGKAPLAKSSIRSDTLPFVLITGVTTGDWRRKYRMG